MLKHIRFFLFPNVLSLDVTGPLEVFAVANELHTEPLYKLSLLSEDGLPIRTSSGMRMEVDGRWTDVESDDIACIPGGDGVQALLLSPSLKLLCDCVRKTQRAMSICTGAFILGEAGLLDGRRVTTHWLRQNELANRYPSARVERDVVYITDDNVYSSAGVTAGMDLALAVIEREAGVELAFNVAAFLVLGARRQGDAPQVSKILLGQSAQTKSIARLQAYISSNLRADLRVGALARRVGMSPRNFSRTFRRDIGVSPAEFVRAVRLERSRWMLTKSDASVDAIAAQCGFQSRQTFRRAFLEAFSMSPATHRSLVQELT